MGQTTAFGSISGNISGSISGDIAGSIIKQIKIYSMYGRVMRKNRHGVVNIGCKTIAVIGEEMNLWNLFYVPSKLIYVYVETDGDNDDEIDGNPTSISRTRVL